ncbi:hypothetical protein BD289DRAFT_142332 [Coniella lustricola]|uniref:Uncharacterized protein n=1 Tax=Coniella lustricola TaxID=2025994 RepID=A0A2T2ZVB1_9PEZI|nr:hypothetical protein BD289DRAFT_142332 [Coniella lustricola]
MVELWVVGRVSACLFFFFFPLLYSSRFVAMLQVCAVRRIQMVSAIYLLHETDEGERERERERENPGYLFASRGKDSQVPTLGSRFLVPE